MLDLPDTVATDYKALKEEVTLTQEQDKALRMLVMFALGQDSLAAVFPPANGVSKDEFERITSKMFSELASPLKSTYGMFLAEVEERKKATEISKKQLDSLYLEIHNTCLAIHNADTAKIKFVYEPKKPSAYCPYLA